MENNVGVSGTYVPRKKYGAFTSSEDYNKLADTVKGVIVGLSSLIIFFAAMKGITVTEAGVLAFAQQAGTTIGAVGTAVGAIFTLYGLIKKGVIAVSQKF